MRQWADIENARLERDLAQERALVSGRQSRLAREEADAILRRSRELLVQPIYPF